MLKLKQSLQSDSWINAFQNGLQDILDAVVKLCPEKPGFALSVLAILWCSAEPNEKAKYMLKLFNTLD